MKFNSVLVGRLTTLEGKVLDDFMLRYRPDYAWINHATDYEILAYITEKVKESEEESGESNGFDLQ